VNGRFVPENQAVVSIADRGFLHGYGVFETMRVYGGKLFRASDHLARLASGMHHVGIVTFLTGSEIRAVCDVLIHRNAVTSGVARVYATRDSLVATVQARVFEVKPRTAVFSSIMLDPTVSRFKTANRLPYILAQREADQAMADDAVLFNAAGNAVEFTTSNLFMLRDGTIITPPLTDGPLPGITRAVVTDLVRSMNIELRVESIRKDRLLEADELFATNSLMEIVPVTRLARHEMGTGTAGRLLEAYRRIVRDELSLPSTSL
jgi:branched-subunit amino acid aminotransferase/4-amino-4-deoxychorismate lyase